MNRFILLIVSAVLLFSNAAAHTLKAVAQQRVVVTGTLLDQDGKPISKAHVHLTRMNESKVIASVEVAQDGSFQLATSERGLLRLQFTGINHIMREVPLLAEESLQL